MHAVEILAQMKNTRFHNEYKSWVQINTALKEKTMQSLS